MFTGGDIVYWWCYCLLVVILFTGGVIVYWLWK